MRKLTLKMAYDFIERLDKNEEHMGEHAAHALTCEQFGIDEIDGYDLIWMLSIEKTGTRNEF